MTSMPTPLALRPMALIAAVLAGKPACVHPRAASAGMSGLGGEQIRPYSKSGIRLVGKVHAGTQEWQNDPWFSTDTGVLAGGPPMR